LTTIKIKFLEEQSGTPFVPQKNEEILKGLKVEPVVRNQADATQFDSDT
jgi:hypothetical protein